MKYILAHYVTELFLWKDILKSHSAHFHHGIQSEYISPYQNYSHNDEKKYTLFTIFFAKSKNTKIHFGPKYKWSSGQCFHCQSNHLLPVTAFKCPSLIMKCKIQSAYEYVMWSIRHQMKVNITRLHSWQVLFNLSIKVLFSFFLGTVQNISKYIQLYPTHLNFALKKKKEKKSLTQARPPNFEDKTKT